MNSLHRLLICLAGAVLVVALGASPGRAGVLTSTFVGSGTNANGQNVAAQVVFSFNTANPTVLDVTLSNTYTGTYSSTDVTTMLTAVYFDVIPTPNPQLQLTSAYVSAGSKLVNADGTYTTSTTTNPINILAPPSGTTQGGWAYAYTTSTDGLGTVGLNMFPGSDVGTPGNGQANYALANATFSPSQGNSSIKYPVINNSADFALTGLPTGFNFATGISNVVFQYGTSTTETQLLGTPGGSPPPPPPPPPPIPEPATFFGALIAAAGVAIQSIRTRRRAAA